MKSRKEADFPMNTWNKDIILEASHITHRYDEKNIIEDINISLNKGEIIALLGISGVGKTTLFHVLAGLSKPLEGSICLEGVDVTGQTGHISYMLQNDMLLPYYTIEDNIALPLRMKGVGKKKAREEVLRYLEDFSLDGTQKKYPTQLSGGMRQRAALLRTYLFSGKAALLDEPFSALDAITKGEMHHWYLNIMKRLKMPTIFITHDIDEALYLANRVLIMTGKPGRLTDEIKIKKSEEDLLDYNLTSEFLAYKRHIIEQLKKAGSHPPADSAGSNTVIL